MEMQNHQCNRNLSIILVILYILTIAIFVYLMLASEPELTEWWMIPVKLLIIFFISLFSLDVFGMGASPLEVWGACLMHNNPPITMIIFLLFAWKRPVVSFLAFLIAGVAFTVLFVRDLYALPNLLLFVFPILLIASLFYSRLEVAQTVRHCLTGEAFKENISPGN